MENVRRLPVEGNDEAASSLDDLAREGARRMIAAALEAEVAEYVDRSASDLDQDGRRLVVRNGLARERKVTVGSGTVAVRAPRVNDKRVDPETGKRRRVQLEDPARVCAALAEGHRRAADLVFAWALDRRLRARAQ